MFCRAVVGEPIVDGYEHWIPAMCGARALACLTKQRQSSPIKKLGDRAVKFYFSPAMSSPSVRVTNYPAIKNAPLVGLAEGNGSFNNLHLAGLLIVVPYILKSFLPIIKYGGFKTYLFMFILTAAPTAVGYWTFNSIYGFRKNDKVVLPGNDIEQYITIKDPELKKLYKGKEKIPMQLFHDAYFEGKIDFKGVCVFVLRVLVACPSLRGL